jgi:hypothetical protein
LGSGLAEYDEGKTNVLLLGGSVLDAVCNHVLKPMNNPNINFYNLSAPGHASLDSLYKLRYVLNRGYRFDYVVFYHAINEVRANNVPPDMFREGYEHYGFYLLTNKVFDGKTALSFFVKNTRIGFYIYKMWVDTVLAKDLLPPELPRFGEKTGWLAFGGDVKSEKEFRKNLLQIIDTAKRGHCGLIVPKFAYHLPKKYTAQRFADRQLGYEPAADACPAEIWGHPVNVIKGIDAHNEVIADLKDNFIYVNTDVISGDIRNFIDICHFSPRGGAIFSNLLIGSISPRR